MYQYIVMTHAHLLTAPMAPPGVPTDPPVAPGGGGLPSTDITGGANINWPGLTAVGAVVVTILLAVFGIGLLARPRKTSLAEAGKSSGVAGIGLAWVSLALVMGAGVLIGVIGSFAGFLVR